MRLRISLTTPGSRVAVNGQEGVLSAGQETDVLLDVPAGTPWEAAEPHLLAVLGTTGLAASGAQAGLHVDGRRVSGDAVVGSPPLVQGAMLSLGAPEPTELVRGGVQLRVESGPDAGAVCPLEPGRHRIGRALGAEVRIEDPDVSRVHAVVQVGWDSVLVNDAGSTNGSTLDGEALGGHAVPFPVGARLTIGGSTLVLDVPREAPAPLHADGSARLAFNRPPRIESVASPVEIWLPAPPRPRDRIRFPLIALLLPLLAAAAMAVVFSPMFLVFGLLSPLMLGGQWLSDRTNGARAARQERQEYEARLGAAQDAIDEALDAERDSLRTTRPDAATVGLIAGTPTERLWQRRPDDDDFLLVRLGTGTVSAAVRVHPPDVSPGSAAAAPGLVAAPVAVPLREVGNLGLAGPRRQAMATARFVLGQLATLQSPRYLSLVLLCGRADDYGERDWGWVRWLPHAEPTAGQSCELLVGVGREQAQARVAELTALMEARQAGLAILGRWTGPRTVVVLDGARQLRELAGVARLLADGPAVGIHAVCIEDDPAALPAECGARAVISGEVGGDLTVDAVGHSRVTDAAPDGVSGRWAARLSRRLSRLRDATPNDDAGLPESIGLVDLLSRSGASEPFTAGRIAADSIAADWSQDGRRTQVPVGVGTDGPLLVDLRRDGPHALVAGTTGAGKSELLQTLVASLALSNRPDELSFVLVDYKGGAAFAECAQLPHTVGMVTDLDEHLTERALASLSAELERRERLLADAKAATLEDYQRSSPQNVPVLPRLVIVVDEFASLVEELPEFVRGLVGIAMRGRSLGVHLVLATQRPAGAVSADIRANVGLRIALRVADAADSTDVIDAPDAARIDQRTPGRAYVRRGSDPAVCFQAARVSGRSGETRSISVRAVSWSQLGDPPPLVAPGEARAHDSPSDLAGILAATREAARLLGVTSPSSPWLPPLPERLSLDDLPTMALPTRGLPVIPYGLTDLPERGVQESVSLDLEHGGHLIVVGAPRTGRSTLLRTLAGSITARATPADVHIYGIDCGNGALLPVADLPHCGCIATGDQVDRVDRLLTRLQAEVSERAAALALAGCSDLDELRRRRGPAHGPSYLVLLLDRWEGFLSMLDDVDGGRLTDAVLRLLREGPAAGLRTVATADRSGLVGRIASLIEDKLVLRLGDRSDFALAGLTSRQLPRDLPPGRAVRAGSGTEVQVAVLGTDASGPGQVAHLRALAQSATAALDGTQPRPFRVAELPHLMTYDEMPRPEPSGPLWTTVGVGGDECLPVGVDLDRDGPALVVAGPARSGRTATLLAVGTSLAESGARLVVVAARPSALRTLAQMGGTTGAIDSTDRDAAVLLRAMLERVGGPLAVLVDDAEMVVDTPVGQALEEFARTAPDSLRALVVAGTTGDLLLGYRGFVSEARRHKVGLLLSPESSLDGDLLGVRLPRSVIGRGPRGRGVLAVRGQLTSVQVPLVSAAEPVARTTG